MNAPEKLPQAEAELCTIILSWSDALLVMGSFQQALKRTERDFSLGKCIAADLESETAIASELQRQVLFRLPPSQGRQP
ncbi:hypothetical protein [Candidatus Ferrigenium straubiae]|jgi:hypothetical protein|uniref:hypothetical protein n=1 Tax=Candidatus Ferrigenium straubiae TaxID=2919506 RepID=UPI003F4AE1A1